MKTSTRLTADAYHTTADAMRPGDGAENQMMYAVGPDGHAKALRLVPKGRGDFFAHLDATRDRYPLDPADIVDDGWPRDADGRGLSVLEVEQMRRRDEAAA